MKKVLVVGMAVMLLLCGCGQSETSEVPELINAVGVDMDTAEVVKMDLSGVTSFSAQIQPKIEALSFLSSGSIDTLKVSIGDKVKKGQLLATLAGGSGKAKSLKSEIRNMESQNEDTNKQSRYDINMLEEKVKDLKKGYEKEKNRDQKKKIEKQITEAEYDVKIAEEKLKQQKELQRLEIDQKRRELAEAEKSSGNNKLFSTIDGEVISTTGGSGYMVQGGTAAIQIANMKAPRLKTTYISTSTLAKAVKCMALINGKRYEIVAEEQEVSRYDAETGKHPENTWFDFVDENVDAEVGKSAAVELYTDSVEDALVVPVNAVLGTGEEKYVYIVEGDAKIKTSVTTGTKTDAYVQIVTGVKEGDVVYVEG